MMYGTARRVSACTAYPKNPHSTFHILFRIPETNPYTYYSS